MGKNQVLFALLIFFATSFSHAAQGGFSVGGFFGTTSASQTDLNTLISTARATGVTTSDISSALEFSGHWTYRFSGMLALQFRPSYFYAKETGKNGLGEKYDYSVTGFTVFPVFRWYLLEDSFIRFFTQLGVGFGFATGNITEGAASTEFSGNNMGYMAGLGAEFCFSANHCINVEGNFRYLPFERMEADSVTGTFAAGSITTPVKGGEVELNNKDVATTFSGIMGVLGYTYYF